MSTTTTVSNVSSSNPTAAAAPTNAALITSTANGTNHGTKVDLQSSYLALIAGLLAFYQPTDTFALKSGTIPRDELIAQFQKFIALAESTKASNQAWRNTVQAEREVEAEVRPLRQGVRSIVTAKYGKGGTELLQFGFLPAKSGKKTAASKAQAVVKAKSTRTARATKGAKQKKVVKGTVTSVVLTPVTTSPPAAAVSNGVPAAGAGASTGATPHAS